MAVYIPKTNHDLLFSTENVVCFTSGYNPDCYCTDKRIISIDAMSGNCTSILYKHIQSVSIRLRSRGLVAAAVIGITLVAGNAYSLSFAKDADAVKAYKFILEQLI